MRTNPLTWLNNLSHTPIVQVRWQDALIAIGLAVGISVIRQVFINDPTAVIVSQVIGHDQFQP